MVFSIRTILFRTDPKETLEVLKNEFESTGIFGSIT